MAETKQVQLERLLNVVKTWIETQSGPSFTKVSLPDLQLKLTIRGYKKITLERTFGEADQ